MKGSSSSSWEGMGARGACTRWWWVVLRWCLEWAILVGWFWLSLVALVGALAIVSLGFDDMLGEGGLTSTERVVRLAVAYGVPMFVFTLTTWRATTVIDEVVDLRWRRWRAAWEQTLNDMAAQPPPPPEH